MCCRFTSLRVVIPILAAGLICTAASPTLAQGDEPALDIETRPRLDVDVPMDPRARAADGVPLFEDTINVGRRTYRVQAVDRRGVPIEGLGRRDFDVKLGDEFIHVDTIQWINAGSDAASVGGTTASVGGTVDDPDGFSNAVPRHYLLFIQAGREPFFGRGHLRLQRQIREFLGALEPGASVGVVSFDSRLKLWLDFTLDRDIVEKVVSVAGRFTAEPGAQPATEASLPSLRGVWDAALTRSISTAEEGLEITANYLEELPGAETMIYVGSGLAHFSRRSAQRVRQFRRATESLADAGVQVFVVGILDTDLQSFGNGLLELADVTGGDYFHSRDITPARLRELASSLSAHYLLTLDEADLADAMRREPKRDPHRDLEIELRFRDGRVYGPPRPVK